MPRVVRRLMCAIQARPKLASQGCIAGLSLGAPVRHEALAANELATGGSQVEYQLGEGAFVVGYSIQVADINLYRVLLG